MISKEMQDILTTHKLAALREYSYFEIFKIECELGNWKNTEEIHSKICGLLDAKLDSYVEYWKLARKEDRQGGVEAERME